MEKLVSKVNALSEEKSVDDFDRDLKVVHDGLRALKKKAVRMKMDGKLQRLISQRLFKAEELLMEISIDLS